MSEFLQPANIIGKRFGRYLPLESLGKGNNTLVVKAEDPQLRRLVAVKLFSPDAEHHQPDDIQREARMHALVTPIPGVLPFLEIGTARLDNPPTALGVDRLIHPDVHYITTMLANGGSLQQALTQGHPLSAEQIVAYGVKLFGTLDAAHQTGVMHLDVKPANIVDHEGEIFLADWGTSEHARDLTDKNETPTRKFEPVGTPGYVDPKQREGLPTVWSDLYSGAATLWALMAGEQPFLGGRAVVPEIGSVLGKGVSSETKALDKLFHAAMSPDPRDRAKAFGSISGIAYELQEVHQRATTTHEKNTTVIPLGDPTQRSQELTERIEGLRETKNGLATEIAQTRQEAEGDITKRREEANAAIALDQAASERELAYREEEFARNLARQQSGIDAERDAIALEKEAARRIVEQQGLITEETELRRRLAEQEIAEKRIAGAAEAAQLLTDAETIATGNAMHTRGAQKREERQRRHTGEDAAYDLIAQERRDEEDQAYKEKEQVLTADIFSEIQLGRQAEADAEARSVSSATVAKEKASADEAAEQREFAELEGEIWEEATADRIEASRQEVKLTDLSRKISYLQFNELFLQGEVAEKENELAVLAEQNATETARATAIGQNVQGLTAREAELRASIAELAAQENEMKEQQRPKEVTPSGDPALDAERANPRIERAKELLGKDFLGVEAIRDMEEKLRSVGVDVTFDLDDLPNFPYTKADLVAAKKLGEILVLRPDLMNLGGKILPVSLELFDTLFNHDPLQQKQKLFDKDVRYTGMPVYKEPPQKFRFSYNSPLELNLEWALVQKEGASRNSSPYHTKLEQKGATTTELKSRTAQQIIWDTIIYYINTGTSLLQENYAQSSTRILYTTTQQLSGKDSIIHVGGSDSRTFLYLNADHYAHSDTYLKTKSYYAR